MVRKRKVDIENKVFQERDVQKVAEFFRAKYSEAAKKSKYIHQVTLWANVTAEDGTQYELESLDVNTDLQGLLANKKLSSIEFYFNTRYGNTQHHIDFSVTEGERYGNKAVVSSTNETWFNDSLAKIEEILSDVKNQSNWFLHYYPYIRVLAAAYFGLMYFLIIVAVANLFKVHKHAVVVPAAAYYAAEVVLAILMFATGWGISAPIMGLLKKLWPSIEFDFGPAHKRKAQSTRRILGAATVGFIIPVALWIAALFIH